ncbi:MAG: undecaprenyl-diphosphate phosphatase [Candidatus Pacearchaeota archaeon]|nr:undecaprenyl-diphosphate phosphatase [Candidatus Pacearchaeota archaeon]
MIELMQAIILSVIQGVTEWLPISSSGHLAFIQYLFGINNLAFDVFLHFASILAVIFVFRKEIASLFDFTKKKNIKYFLLLFIATIPAAIVGYLLRNVIGDLFSKIIFVGIFFMINGVFIFSTKFIKPSKEKREHPSLFGAIGIGIAQVFALLPGISRSGSTISAGLFNGVDREEAVKFSFLLSIPVVLGAAVLETKDFIFSNIDIGLLIISFITTFFISILAIILLKKIVKGNYFYLFGIYTFILGIVVLAFNFFKG